MLHFSLGKQRVLGGAVSDVENQSAELPFVVRQHGFGSCERLEDHFDHLDARSIDARQKRLSPGDISGHQMNRHLESSAQHSERISDTSLFIDDELLRNGVEDLAIRWEGSRLGGFEYSVDVLTGDLTILPCYRHNAAGIDTADIGASHTDVGSRDLDSGHDLGFFGSLP